MLVNQAIAQIIIDAILSIDEKIWAASIIEKNGNIIAAKSKPSFKQTFGVVQDGEKNGGSLAVATLSLVNEVKDISGEAQTVITIYNNCKLMLLNISSYEILVGLALQRLFNCEDDNFIEKIKQLIITKVKTTQ